MVEDKILEGLKTGNNLICKDFYKQTFPMVYKLVSNGGGDMEQAKDIMQESLFAIIKNINKPEFALTCKLSTYLYSVARNLFYKKRGSESKVDSYDNQGMVPFIPIADDEIEEKKEFEAKYLRVVDAIELLGDNCKKLIKENLLNGKSLEEIAPMINVAIESMRVTKHRCIKKLRSLTQ